MQICIICIWLFNKRYWKQHKMDIKQAQQNISAWKFHLFYCYQVGINKYIHQIAMIMDKSAVRLWQYIKALSGYVLNWKKNISFIQDFKVGTKILALNPISKWKCILCEKGTDPILESTHLHKPSVITKCECCDKLHNGHWAWIV